MALETLNVNMMQSPLKQDYAALRLQKLQAELISTARTWAMDEVGAAMAHQLNEPLTALLVYLHEIKDTVGRLEDSESAARKIRDIVDKSVRETERACEIMEQMGHVFDAPSDAETAVARGREAIDWLAEAVHTRKSALAPAQASSLHDVLTPREREVLALITEGVSNKEGGYRLGISMRTFEVHRAHIMGKLGAKNAADLVRMALSEHR